MRRSILILKLFLVSSRVCLAAPCDNIAVQTFDQELVDIGSRNVERVFVLPEGPARRITMTYTLDCPEGGCDPWDRKGNVYVVLPDSSKLEIGRIITPYKKACSWSVDVTPFQQMLQGEVNLGLFIDTWVGGGQGWLVSVDFLIEQGVADQEPIGVVSLWQGNPELGNYLDWLGGESINTTFFTPRTVQVPADMGSAKLRFVVTGHGQGNTDGAAEFRGLDHWVELDGEQIAERLHWRDNCRETDCRPQNGNWQGSRAGWCPGDVALPWEIDITDRIAPGDSFSVQHLVEEYVNYCSPLNPECDPGEDCMWFVSSCEYDGGNHTLPHYWVESQAIFYRANDCAPDVQVIDPPDTVHTGGSVELGASISNCCESVARFDQVMVTIEGPANRTIAAHDGRIIPVPPTGEHLATANVPVPQFTPVGTYTVTLDALLEDLLVGSDSFQAEVVPQS